MTHFYLDDVIYQPFKMKQAFDQFLKFNRSYIRTNGSLKWLKYQFIEIEMNYEIPIAIALYSTKGCFILDG